MLGMLILWVFKFIYTSPRALVHFAKVDLPNRASVHCFDKLFILFTNSVLGDIMQRKVL
jgi:hypothetical protein